MAKAYDHLFKLLLIGDSGVGKTCLIIRFAEDNFNSTYISTIGIDFKIRTVEIEGKRIKLQVWRSHSEVWPDSCKEVEMLQVWRCCRCIDAAGVETLQVWRHCRCIDAAGVEVLQLWRRCRCGDAAGVEMLQETLQVYRRCSPTPSVAKAELLGKDFPSRSFLLPFHPVKTSAFRDTAGQERFKTITTAYYRGAMGIILVYDITDEKSFENIQNWMKSIKERLLLGNKCDMEAKRKVQKEQADKLAREHGIRFFETSAKSSMNVDEAFNSLAHDILLKSGGRRLGNNSKPSSTDLKPSDKKNTKCSLG
ncbi:hypothetical protein U0070_011165 [Myodes glareolus]|uniref:small monomeric GTPase n=1 Tax=Myodes glareolus TaxID=447135 RepID=A0AAW0HHA3_MYOGA